MEFGKRHRRHDTTQQTQRTFASANGATEKAGMENAGLENTGTWFVWVARRNIINVVRINCMLLRTDHNRFWQPVSRNHSNVAAWNDTCIKTFPTISARNWLVSLTNGLWLFDVRSRGVQMHPRRRKMHHTNPRGGDKDLGGGQSLPFCFKRK